MKRLLTLSKIKKILSELLIPNQHVDHVWDIDLENLKKQNFSTLVIDLDETILANSQRNLSLNHLNWLQKCKDIGFKIFILSNNRSKKRVQLAAQQVDCIGLYMAMKPFTFSIHQLQKSYQFDFNQSIIIGDQVFKDVVLARWLNVYSILVNPITKPKKIIARIQYSIEKKLMSYIK